MCVPTLAPVDSPLNMGVSSLAVLPLTQVSTVKPRDLLTTFSPCITSISYFLLQARGRQGGEEGERGGKGVSMVVECSSTGCRGQMARRLMLRRKEEEEKGERRAAWAGEGVCGHGNSTSTWYTITG